MLRSLLALVLLLIAAPAHAVVYLCPTDGDGTDGNEFKSRALSERLPGRGNIDHIRADLTQPGLMLCESDVLPSNMDGVIVLGDTREETLSARVKTDIAAATKLTIRGATVEDVIKELVIPRMPRPASGQYDIILTPSRPRIKEAASLQNDIYYKGLAVALQERGHAVVAGALDALSASVAWASRLATETFNCSDNASLTCVHTWADKTGTALSIVSNQASGTGTTGTPNELYADASVATVDHEVSVTVVAAAKGTGFASCSVMGRTTADATRTYYRTTPNLASSGELNSVFLIRTVAAANTTLGEDTADWSNGDTFAVRMVGSTISAWKNNVQILSVTDANITTGTYGGLRYATDNASGSCTFDNYRINDVTTVRPPWSN